MQSEICGLTTEEAEQRQKQAEAAAPRRAMTKTTGQIIRENVLTLFNLLNFFIAVLMLAAGAYTNMLFFAIIVLNTLIGIFQELKAKKMVDKLSLLNRPRAVVLRDGKKRSLPAEELVRDDVMILESGQKICGDAVVLSGSVEVNESLLTGESDAVMKEKGDALYSGSSVIAGQCRARVTHAGYESYIAKLADEAKAQTETGSELLAAMRRVTRFTSVLILPIGALLFAEAFLVRQAHFEAAVVAACAALLGMLPKGLVLLISVSLARGVIRLSKRKILVQNIYSLETLAHADVLCLDKTGTLTDGKMRVCAADYLGLQSSAGQREAESLLRSYLAASGDNNATIKALREYFKPEAVYQASGCIPFSSGRKWGAVRFGTRGTVFIGAPERIFGQCPDAVFRALDEGKRVLAAGYSAQDWTSGTSLPADITPLFSLTLEDTIRSRAAEVLRFFEREGVAVKVISGDHVKTVSMAAKKAGVTHWDRAIDLSAAGSTIDYDAVCEEYSVFARATPQQKQALVAALKRRGHRVAMTGDGVNDLLALRTADCSIAMAEGSDASRQVAQIVLLKSDFTHLPGVLLEGRRVVNNVTRTAGVFFIKTIYSLLLSLLCLASNTAFPFIPIQITLIDAVMEAYPAFLTIFESDTRSLSGSFLKKALGRALPFALAATGMISFAASALPLPAEQKQTVMYLLLILTTMAAVVKSCFPFTALRAFICVTMAAGTATALALFPSLLEITAISPALFASAFPLFAAGAAALALLYAAERMLSRRIAARA